MNKSTSPHPKNVPGPFYVEYGCCTACSVPVQNAPSMFVYDSEYHCFVHCQPRTEDEISDMIRVAWMAELECIRYRGSDPDILRRLAELDLRQVCDSRPPAHIVPVIRNHVSFTSVGVPPKTTTGFLAEQFQDYLMSLKDVWLEIKYQPIQCSKDSSFFDFSWYDDRLHSIHFSSIPNQQAEWHVYYPLKNTLGDRGVGNLVSGWLNRNGSEFSNFKWYTEADWRGSKTFQKTPW